MSSSRHQCEEKLWEVPDFTVSHTMSRGPNLVPDVTVPQFIVSPREKPFWMLVRQWLETAGFCNPVS